MERIPSMDSVLQRISIFLGMAKLDMVLQLGDPRLYEVCAPVQQHELPGLKQAIQDMHDIIFEFRAKYNAGRAIAAPQIGVMKRLIYMHIDRPVVIINPVFSDLSDEMFEMWDDCMSFPNLLVRLKRHKSLTITFLDENWQEHSWHVQDDLSELLQHEYDHLDGILATQRALDGQSFKWR
jgi:peptide deformylase